HLYKNESSPLATADLGGGTLQVTVPLNGPPERIKQAILERRKAQGEGNALRNEMRHINGETSQHYVNRNEDFDNSDERQRAVNANESEIYSVKQTVNKTGTSGESKSNGGRRSRVRVNRRLKNNLNNNATRAVGSHANGENSINIHNSSALNEANSNKPYNISVSDIPKASRGVNRDAGTSTPTSETPTQTPQSMDVSVAYVTAPVLEVWNPTPTTDKPHQVGNTKATEINGSKFHHVTSSPFIKNDEITTISLATVGTNRKNNTRPTEYRRGNRRKVRKRREKYIPQ
ncbi:hypothetical protein SK128_014374, partial [Halocaridina rubra]